MIKILCFPLTKLVLFITGFFGAASALRASSTTFEAVFANSRTYLTSSVLWSSTSWLFNLTRLGLVLGLIVFVASVSLLFFAIWKTNPTKKAYKDTIFRLWHSLDIIVVLLIAIYISLYFLAASYNNWWNVSIIIAYPFLAYTVIMFAIAVLIARIRDNEFKRTLYWVHFFKAHPVWKPLGFLFALLLAGNLFLMTAFIHEVAELFGLRGYATLVRVHLSLGRYWEYPLIDMRIILSIFSVISLSALTYIIVLLMNVEARFTRASADKIRAEQFKSELITNVSHDIKTPLTSIINYVDLLKAQPLEDDAKEYVAVLDKKSARLKILIDDLMDASKAGTGNVQVILQEINFAELIGQIAGEFDEQFIENNLDLVMRGTDEPVIIFGDNRHLWRVLENLFSNSVKYALPSTRVFAELTHRNDVVVFTLKNTSGIPIDAPRESLDEQFIRGDRARESEGSGLGLYIAKSLIELMGYSFAIKISGDLFEVEICFNNI